MPSAGTNKQRGYDHRHRQRRARLAPQVAAGRATCWRCGLPITPDMQWDLGHEDQRQPDGSRRYMGPEHALKADCPAGGNRATKGRRPPPAPPTDTTRTW